MPDRPLADEKFCYLTTIGRVTGRPHTIEIWFVIDGRTVFILSDKGEPAHWVKNIDRQPHVTIVIGRRVFRATGRRAAGDEIALASRLVCGKYNTEEEDLSDWTPTALTMAFDLAEAPLPPLHGEG